MRALAEFVMRGRMPAVGVAVVAVVVPFLAWVGAAVVSLVTLRRGAADGIIILGWTALPALAMVLTAGDIGPLATLLAAALCAVVLRVTVAWSYTLAAAVATGMVTALLLLLFGSTYLEALSASVGELFRQVQEQMGPDVRLPVPTPGQVSGFLGFSVTCSAVVALLLARWWQALLYNPGGFREEFHALRLPRGVTTALIGFGLLLALAGPDYQIWALMFSVPFTVAGFALVHGLAAQRGWGRGIVVAVYLAWLLLDPAKAVLLLAAVADSWWDFRGRGGKKAQ